MRSDDQKQAEVETYDGDSGRPSYNAYWNDDHYNKLIEYGPGGSFEAELQDISSRTRILFLGVGNGANAAAVKQAHPEAAVFGIELSAERVTKTFKQHGDEVSLARADAECLPFDDSSFDIVVAHAVLHHLPDWRGKGLNEIVRVLKVDGSFVFYEPGRYNPPAAFRRRFIPSDIHTPGEEPFDPRELRSELSVRFSNVEMTGHCLFSHILPVIDNYLPIPIPFSLTRLLYTGEQGLFNRTGPLPAWIVTGRADL